MNTNKLNVLTLETAKELTALLGAKETELYEILRVLEKHNKNYKSELIDSEDLENRVKAGSTKTYNDIKLFRENHPGLEHQLRASRVSAYVSQNRPLSESMEAELFEQLTEIFESEDSENDDDTGFGLCLDLFNL
jgi:hypothetical protein